MPGPELGRLWSPLNILRLLSLSEVSARSPCRQLQVSAASVVLQASVACTLGGPRGSSLASSNLTSEATQTHC